MDEEEHVLSNIVDIMDNNEYTTNDTANNYNNSSGNNFAFTVNHNISVNTESSDCEYTDTSCSSNEITTSMVSKFRDANVQDVYFALLALFVTHSPSELLFSNIIRIVNVLINNETEKIPIKLDQFLNRINLSPKPVRHYYCNQLRCNNKYIGITVKQCPSCKKLPNVQSYFLYNSITTYLKDLLENCDLDKYLSIDQCNNIEDSYTDIKCGSEFKRTQNSNPGCIQLLLNIDGVPLHSTTSKTVYPVTVTPINYPYAIRHKRILCNTLWSDIYKPNFNELLKPFISEMLTLGSVGMYWMKNNEIKHTKVFLTLVTADSVARAPLQGIQQFNGKQGCPSCLIVTTPLRANNALHRYYKYIGNPIPRNAIDTIRDAEKASISKRPVNGVTGLSPFHNLPSFDLINGVVIDSMHAVFHGVFKDILGRTIKIMSKHNLTTFNFRLQNVQLPQEIPRTLRTIADFSKGNWRASELRTVTYLCPILFRGLLPALHYDNFVLFSTAMYYLHSSVINKDDLPKIHRQIQRFSRQLHRIYNDNSVFTHNVHLLLHLVEKVKLAGPLQTHSCDDFERLFGTMLHVQHGSRGASNQILRYFNLKHAIAKHSQLQIRNESINYICNRLLHNCYSNKVYFIDHLTTVTGKQNELELVQTIPGSTVKVTFVVQCFPKCIYNYQVFKTFESCKTNKRIDCYFHCNNKFYLILYIVKSSNTVFFLCNRLVVHRMRSLITTSQLELKYPLCKIRNILKPIKRINLSDSIRKCCLIRLNNDVFLLPSPAQTHRS